MRSKLLIVLLLLLIPVMAQAQSFPNVMGGVGIGGEIHGPSEGAVWTMKVGAVKVPALVLPRGLNDSTAAFYVAVQHGDTDGGATGGMGGKLMLAIRTLIPQTTVIVGGGWLDDIALRKDPDAEEPQLEPGYVIDFGLHFKLTKSGLGNLIIHSTVMDRGASDDLSIHLFALYSITAG